MGELLPKSNTQLLRQVDQATTFGYIHRLTRHDEDNPAVWSAWM
jgi:hypothetical protein